MTDPTDGERYPTLTPHGARMLEFLREHPHAPLFRNQSGNRLDRDDVARVQAFEREALATPLAWTPGQPPPWIAEWIARCHSDVPHFRARGAPPPLLADVPTTSRADLSRDIAAFVPDSAPIDRLINFRTSGTTGHPLLLASHPVVAASYLAFHKKALRRFGVELRAGRGQVGVVLLGLQRKCFTYVSVTPTMDDSGLAKINLHPDDWRHPDDRQKYLAALDAEVLAGDPLSFAELAALPLDLHPRALLSTSMALSPALRVLLAERFRCPVLDLYSLNEAGPIAVADPALGGHVLLQHGMYVEILDEHARPAPRGEITLTGGFNFCLPLLRYRTGDHAGLRVVAGELVLTELEGRPPVRFRTAAGAWINNIEVTHALQRFAITQFALRQAADGRLVFRVAGPAELTAIERALRELFGALPLELAPTTFGDKVVQYESELAGAAP